MNTQTTSPTNTPRTRVKKRWEIFCAGTHTASNGTQHTYTDVELSEIAHSLNVAAYAPPLVKGHPKNDDPAYGRVVGLQVEGSKLFGEVEIDSDIYSEVDQLKWQGVSVAIYARDNPNNPTPGKLHLRHLGLCGAVGPAIKGMTSINYSEGDTPDNCYMFDEVAGWMVAYPFEAVARFLRRLREQTIADKGVDAADNLLPNWQIEQVEESAKQLRQISENATPPTPTPLFTEATMKDEEIAAMQAENARLKKANAQMLAAQAEAQRLAAHAANLAFCEKLVTELKLIPAQVPSQVKLLDDLAKIDPAQDTEWQEQHAQEFSEGTLPSRYEAEKANLLKLPKLPHLDAMFGEGVNTKAAQVEGKTSPLVARAEAMAKAK